MNHRTSCRNIGNCKRKHRTHLTFRFLLSEGPGTSHLDVQIIRQPGKTYNLPTRLIVQSPILFPPSRPPFTINTGRIMPPAKSFPIIRGSRSQKSRFAQWLRRYPSPEILALDHRTEQRLSTSRSHRLHQLIPVDTVDVQ